MNRSLILLLGFSLAGCVVSVRTDLVTDWNATFRNIAQDDGYNAINNANPGWSTRAMAMANGAIYDVFQSFNRTSTPFLVNTTAPAGASLDAAVNQAAYEVLASTYPGEHSILSNDYVSRLDQIPNSTAKTLGLQFGHQIASAYIVSRKRQCQRFNSLHTRHAPRPMAPRSLSSHAKGVGPWLGNRNPIRDRIDGDVHQRADSAAGT